MTNLRLAAALLSADAGNGGGGGSLLTEAAAADDKGGETKVEAKVAAVELTPEQKAEATKLETEKAAKAALEAAVDDKWAPKLADGQKLDDEQLKGFRELAKKAGFKAGQAQALVDFQLAREAAAEKADTERFAKLRQDARAALKTDPEFGGAQYEKNLRSVQRAMAKFGTSPEFKKWVDAGVGDHPEFVKFVASVGASLGEDPGVKAPGNGATPKPNADLQKFFDKSPELFT